MPLVRIDLIRGARTPYEIKKLADVIQQTLISHFNAPPKDRYQLITQHEPYEIICEDTGLGYQRSEKLISVQLFQQGRDRGTKRGFYNALAENLGKECDLRGEDLIVSCVENTKEDWSFGMGRAQFLDGDL